MLNLACRRKAVLLALSPLLLAANDGECAFLGDVLKPFASVAEMYDSNVFRVKDSGELASLGIADDRLSDFITVVDVGTAIHYTLSKQALDLLLKRDFVRFSHYTDEDVDRDEVSGTLSLSALDKFRLAVNGSYKVDPEPRADFRARDLNVKTTTEVGVLGGYDMPSGLSLEAGYRRDGIDYSLAVFNPNEYDADIYSANASLKLPSEIQFFARYQHEVRKYREAEPVSGVKRDNSADSFRVGLSKSFSPRTAVTGYVGYLNRRYAEVSERDFSGIIGRLQGSYALTAKTGLTVNWERDLYEETYPDSAYSLSDSVSAGAVYLATEKIKASLQERLTWKDYQLIPGSTVSSAPKGTVFIQELTAGVEWTPIDRLTTSLSYQYSTRSSDDSTSEFTDHAVTASLGYKF